MSSSITSHQHDTPAQENLVSKEDRQMFMELGIMASNNVLPWEGHALFGQLLLVDPTAAYPRVGMAYCKIMGGQFTEAHQLLKNSIVESSPLKDYAIALRGLAFHLAKQSQELDQLFKANETSLEKNMVAWNMFQNFIHSL